MNIFVYELRNTTNIQIVSAKESNCGKVGSQSNLRYTTTRVTVVTLAHNQTYGIPQLD